MTKQLLGKILSEISEDVLNESLNRFGNLIRADSIVGHEVCIISNTVTKSSTKISGFNLNTLEDSIGDSISYSDCYLYDSSSIKDPKPVIIKKDGKIYALAPLIKVG